MEGRYLKGFIFLLSSVFFLIHLQAETPEELTAIFFQHLKNLEFEQAYKLLAEEEKEGIEFSDYLNYMNSFYKDSFIEVFGLAKSTSNTLYAFLLDKYLEYRILEIKSADADAVKVQLEITIPNFYAIGFDLADEMPDSGRDNDQDAGTEKKIKTLIQKLYPRGVPVEVKQTEYQIITRDKAQYILTGERSDILDYKVKLLKGYAYSAREDGKLEEAITLYKKALAMNAQDMEIRKALIECETLIEERNVILSKTIAPYITDHLVIAEPVLSSTEWGKNLFCTIKNTGTEIVVYVKLRIIYYSDNESIIDTYSFSPIDISAFNPLHPGSEKPISETIIFFPHSANWGEKKFTLEIIDYKE